MGTVVDLPKDKPPEWIIGPFEEWRVVIDGRRVPRLTAKRQGENVCLVLDGRLTATFPDEHAYQAAWLIANALAIGSGYTHLGAETRDAPFAPKVMRLDSLP